MRSKQLTYLIYALLIATAGLFFFNVLQEYEETGRCSNQVLCKIFLLKSHKNNFQEQAVSIPKPDRVQIKSLEFKVDAWCDYTPTTDPSDHAPRPLRVILKSKDINYQILKLTALDQTGQTPYNSTSLTEYDKGKTQATFDGKLCGLADVQIDIEYADRTSQMKLVERQKIKIEKSY